MDKPEIIEIKKWLKENMTLTVSEEGYGFNGSHSVIRLEIAGEVISEDYIDIKKDQFDFSTFDFGAWRPITSEEKTQS